MSKIYRDSLTFGTNCNNSTPKHTKLSIDFRFIHFEPVGHSLKHGHDPDLETIHTFTGGHENSPNHGLPPYILEGSPEAALYRQKHPELWEPGYYEVDPNDATGSNGAHYAAAIGDHVTLWHIVENHRAEMLHEYDNNGWLPLHEVGKLIFRSACCKSCVAF